MRVYKLMAIMGVALLVSHIDARANFSGSDNFSGTTVNAGNWGSDFPIQGGSVGVFSQNNGLFYSTGGTPTSQDGVAHPWVANFGSYTQDWNLQLNVSIPQVTLNPGQEISLGLVVLNASNNSDDMTMNFQQDPNTPQSIFVAGIDTGANSSFVEQRTASEITSTALQLSWNATTKTLTASYNSGNGWTVVDSENITSSGTNDWGMNASSTFEAGIVGFATNKSVSTSDAVVATDFVAVPEPAMNGYCVLSAALIITGCFLRNRERQARRSS